MRLYFVLFLLWCGVCLSACATPSPQPSSPPIASPQVEDSDEQASPQEEDVQENAAPEVRSGAPINLGFSDDGEASESISIRSPEDVRLEKELQRKKDNCQDVLTQDCQGEMECLKEKDPDCAALLMPEE